MVTLVPYKKKECEIKSILQIILRQNPKVEILYYQNKKEHFHVLGEKIVLGANFIRQWPGNVRCEQITDTQAEWMKKGHKMLDINLVMGHSKEDTFLLQ